MQSPNESIFRTDEGPSPAAQMLLTVIIGLILLLPCTYIAVQNRLLPALDTIAMSQQDVNLIRSQREFVGMENYQRLFSDPIFGSALSYTAQLAVSRALVVAFVPPLVGALAGAQTLPGRLVVRLILGVLGGVISPAALALLWASYWSPLWGGEPSPLWPLPENMALASPAGAVNSTTLLDGLITLGIAVAVGVTAYMAVMRGRHLGGSPGLAGAGVWLMSVLLAGGSAFLSFTVPYLVTGGGPGNSTNSLALYMYQNGFQYLRFGYASAQAALLMAGSAVIVLLVWAILTLLHLRLRFLRLTPKVQESGWAALVSIPLALLVSAPLFYFIVWGLTLPASGEPPPPDPINWEQAMSNTLAAPLRAIWLVQVPVTYLAGLSLGFVRPLGRAFSNLLFLLLLLLAFIPVEALSLAWFDQARRAGILNTFEVLNMPWLVSGAALLVFKLFFDGAHEAYGEARRAGRGQQNALLRTVILPSLLVAALVGAVLSFAAAQSLWWPLTVTNDRELFSGPLQLALVRNQVAGRSDLLITAALEFISRVAIVAAPVFVVLQVVALDWLGIVAGRPADAPSSALEAGQAVSD